MPRHLCCVACAKLCSDMLLSNGCTLRLIFQRIWIAIENISWNGPQNMNIPDNCLAPDVISSVSTRLTTKLSMPLKCVSIISSTLCLSRYLWQLPTVILTFENYFHLVVNFCHGHLFVHMIIIIVHIININQRYYTEFLVSIFLQLRTKVLIYNRAPKRYRVRKFLLHQRQYIDTLTWLEVP